MLTLTTWPRPYLSGDFTVQWLLPCPHCALREEVALHGRHLGGVVLSSLGHDIYVTYSGFFCVAGLSLFPRLLTYSIIYLR